ncbi:MAG: hypothetical protein JXA13_04865 [Anaerolineales bacterium]|nr:hypothetical protein [Anaerolineales bacterium]
MKRRHFLAFFVSVVFLIGSTQACNFPGMGSPENEPWQEDSQWQDEPQMEEPNFEEPPREEPPPEEPPHEEPPPGEEPPPEPQPAEPQPQQPPPQQQPDQNQPPSGANWTTDVAITDIYPDNMPKGTLFLRITNNGPGSLNKVKVNVSCSAHLMATDGSKGPDKNSSFTVNLNLSPGETKAFSTKIDSDTAKYGYDVTCQLSPGFNDPNPGNNTYQEQL